MIAKGLRLNTFFAVLSISLLISYATVTGTDTAQHGSNIPISPEAVCPLLTGQKIPAITLKTIEGQTFDLASSFAKKPTILIFYRGGW